MSGNVELNPGPITINFDSLSVAALRDTLHIIHHSDNNFDIPSTKQDLINALMSENENFVNLAVQKALGLVDHTTANNPTNADPKSAFIKLQQFYIQDTRKWFELAEQLLQACENEQQKKNNILRVIPMEVQTESGIDMTWSYQQIRDRIIAHCDDSNDQKLRKLLGEQHLGDLKPSVALRKLQHLGQGNDNLVRLRFFQIMPDSIKVVLASLQDCSIEKLAETADKMAEQLPQSHTVAELQMDNNLNITHSTQSQPNQNCTNYPASKELSQFRAQITELTKAIQAIQSSSQQNTCSCRSRSRSRETPGQRTPDNVLDPQVLVILDDHQQIANTILRVLYVFTTSDLVIMHLNVNNLVLGKPVVETIHRLFKIHKTHTLVRKTDILRRI